MKRLIRHSIARRSHSRNTLRKGIITKMHDGVKVLARGEITKLLVVKAHKFSKTAKEKIEKIGGKAEVS